MSEDYISKRIAYNFARLRKEKGWTQEEAAAKAGVDRSYPGSIESCSAGFGKRAQQRWAKVFGIDVSEFYKPIGEGKVAIGTQDLDLMNEVIVTVEEMFQKKGLQLPPKKKAELILLIYEELSEDRSKLSTLPGRISKLVKLAS